MECINIKLIKQLKDCAINVSQRKCKNVFAEIFRVELKCVADCSLSSFKNKFKS